MGKNVINPEFRLGPDMYNKPLNTGELIQLIEKESPYIQGKFKTRGYITGDDYGFVNMANFDLEKNSIVDGNVYPEVVKSNEEKIIAQNNISAVEKYFQSRITNRNINLKFYHGNRNIRQCALVNVSKKFSDESENELYEFLYS